MLIKNLTVIVQISLAKAEAYIFSIATEELVFCIVFHEF